MAGRFTRGKARPKGHKPGEMNSVERQYSVLLDQSAQEPDFIGPKWPGAPGPIASYLFECFRLRLAPNTWYVPDFFVVDEDGFIEFHEVKGIWQDAGRVKIKAIAELYPQFRFVAVTRVPKKKGGGWKREIFKSSMSVD